MRRKVTILALTLAATGFTQQSPPTTSARRWHEANERAILKEFTDLLSLPNLARDADNIRRNASAVSAILEKRGVKTRLLETPGSPPVVYGEIVTPGAMRTVLFYA